MKSWEDLIKHFKPNLNEELAVASDGGYYNKPEQKISVSRQEADNIKQITDSMYNELFSGDGVTKVDINDNLKQEIINNLKNSGIKIDYDDEEGQYFYWIADEKDLNIAKEEFKLIVNNLYDQIGGGNLQEVNMINPKYTHFALMKDTDEIINGWDYADIEPAELRQFGKDYFFKDIEDMGVDPYLVKIVTSNYLKKSGIDPFDANNWKK